MQPLGNKILVKDIHEQKTTESGIFLLPDTGPLKKVEIVAVSPDSETKLKVGDICLSNRGGVELEPGLWLVREDLLDAKL
jgi:co-chaperonin GroES (HSP10)